MTEVTEDPWETEKEREQESHFLQSLVDMYTHRKVEV